MPQQSRLDPTSILKHAGFQRVDPVMMTAFLDELNKIAMDKEAISLKPITGAIKSVGSGIGKALTGARTGLAKAIASSGMQLAPKAMLPAAATAAPATVVKRMPAAAAPSQGGNWSIGGVPGTSHQANWEQASLRRSAGTGSGGLAQAMTERGARNLPTPWQQVMAGKPPMPAGPAPTAANYGAARVKEPTAAGRARAHRAAPSLEASPMTERGGTAQVLAPAFA